MRDHDDWYESVRSSIHLWTAPGTNIAPPPVARVLQQVWDIDFGGWERVLDADHAIACFRRHNQYVIDTCPPDRLTIWTATQSWAPLVAHSTSPSRTSRFLTSTDGPECESLSMTSYLEHGDRRFQTLAYHDAMRHDGPALELAEMVDGEVGPELVTILAVREQRRGGR